MPWRGSRRRARAARRCRTVHGDRRHPDHHRRRGRVVPADRLPEAGIDLREHIAQIELNLIRDALDAGGVVAHAAQLLGLRRTTLVEKLRKYGVEREDVALATEN